MKETYPEHITLRGGREIVIRPMTADNATALAEFFRGLPEEDRLYLRDDVAQPSFITKFLANLSDERVFPLIALSDGVIVGNATLYRDHHGWAKHVGQIRVAVARDYQRSGLGTALAHAIVRHAVGIGLDKLVAEVVDNQVGAKRAFQKIGFHAEAVLKGHVKDIHGVRRDLVIMANDVSHIWERMEAMMSDYSPTME